MSSDLFVVVMIEEDSEDAGLSITEQINEVFGPMTEKEADEWTKAANELIKPRKWLIIPLSSPKILHKLNFKDN